MKTRTAPACESRLVRFGRERLLGPADVARLVAHLLGELARRDERPIARGLLLERAAVRPAEPVIVAPADVDALTGDGEPVRGLDHRDPFDLEDALLDADQVARVAGERPVAADHPVTRDVDRQDRKSTRLNS